MKLAIAMPSRPCWTFARVFDEGDARAGNGEPAAVAPTCAQGTTTISAIVRYPM